ncbi:MAG: homocysteine S-methyltransferase family protein [Acidobacteria bacterium]|nr:homocysteine S-methyltransferase family protein [Acidobacteriota bacterium]
MAALTTLPHESVATYLTDGGLETTLVFLEGFDLPCFAAFDLLKDEKGYLALKGYYERYLNIAKNFGFGFVLESPTWRANPDWIERIGYPNLATTEVNRKAARLMFDLKEEFGEPSTPIVVSGCVGTRGDGYQAESGMSPKEARDYHSEQIRAFGEVQVDMISAITMTNVEEASGIAAAAADARLPSVISFTLETDGKLPSGASLKEAIETVDSEVETPPIYYMINCAHPSHSADELILGRGQPWIERIRGVRANASRKSHAELDDSTELDRGEIDDFGSEHMWISDLLPQLKVFGGCCGTDEEHILEIVSVLRGNRRIPVTRN